MTPLNDRHSQPPWERGRFPHDDTDPLAGFANIMDVMLVFALGLLVALIAQSQELRQHFRLEQPQELQQGRELVDTPESLRRALEAGGEGMEPLGQVYRDPQTGKLILIGR